MKAVIEKTNQFGINIYKNEMIDSDSNIIVSPMSLQLGMAILYAGADKKAKQQIGTVMKFPKNNILLLDEQKLLFDAFKDPSLSIESMIFVDQSLTLVDDFKTFAKQSFGIDIIQLPFSTNQVESAVKINDWVSKNTNLKINEIVTKTFEGNVSLLLVNTLYFKGKWLIEFKTKYTKTEDFALNETTTSKVKMMYTKNSFPYAHIDEIRATVLQLPYIGYKFSLFIVLPFEVDGLQDVQRRLVSKGNFSFIFKRLSSLEVEVKIPKFKFGCTIDFQHTLNKLGIKEIFSEKACFKNMVGAEVKVSQVIQVAYIEVDEQGKSESDSGTGGMKKPTSKMSIGSSVAPKTFFADHPFIVYLFTGDNPPVNIFQANVIKVD